MLALLWDCPQSFPQFFFRLVLTSNTSLIFNFIKQCVKVKSFLTKNPWIRPWIIREFKPRRRRQQRERQKSSKFFCTFLCRYYTTTTWKCLISRFMEDANKRRRNFLLFLNISSIPKKSTPGKFAYIRYFKRTKINATKFEKNAIHLKVTFSLPSPSAMLKVPYGIHILQRPWGMWFVSYLALRYQ